MRALILLLPTLVGCVFAASMNRDSSSILDAGSDYRERHESNHNDRQGGSWGGTGNSRGSGGSGSILDGGDRRDRGNQGWGTGTGSNSGSGSSWSNSGGSGSSAGSGSGWGGGSNTGTGSRGSSTGEGSSGWNSGGSSSGSGSGSWNTGTWYDRGEFDRNFERNRFQHRAYCAGIHGKVTCPGDDSKAKYVKVVLTSTDHDYEDRDEETVDEAFTSTQGHYAVYGCTANSASRRNQLHLHLYHTCGTTEQSVQKLKAIISDDSTWGEYRTVNVNLKEPTSARPRFEVLRFFGSVNEIQPPCLN